ncbi:MAG: ABC transporter ATP-binding protein [bacterium]
MPEPAISVRGLSKRYRLGAISRHTLADEFTYLYHKLRGRNVAEHMGRIKTRNNPAAASPHTHCSQDFWALKDVSFDVQPGEIIGIIGGNGAGKSTLLKILSQITEPTEGEAVINGRIGSLLEVGAGFHQELTGRENIYMNGTLLGMKKAEIEKRFADIVEFSEIGKFIDTPVKRYSSGMYVRLAFAVAAHLDTEILLVDEVLAVGDAAFQKKCLSKMDAAAGNNRTILFVSHNMHAISTLCRKAIWMDHGQVRAIGSSREIIADYTAETVFKASTGQHTAIPDESPAIIDWIRVLDEGGEERDILDVSEPLTIAVKVTQQAVTSPLRAVLRLYSTEEDTMALCTTSFHDPTFTPSLEAGSQVYQCRLPGYLLNAGTYWISVGIDRPRKPVASEWINVKSFHLTQSASGGDGVYGQLDGVLSPFQSWRLIKGTPLLSGDNPP